ncbi:MAG: hypothetical protein HXS43_07835, partial [Theionarchaea archaeon]|nr:hypothetical protein [Theionarchaea archaeon]
GFRFPGHFQFAENLLWFCQSKTTIPLYDELFLGATISTGKECRPEVDEKGAQILSSLLPGPERKDVSIIIGGPQVNSDCARINPFLPVKFERDEILGTWCMTRDGERFTGQNCGMVAVVTVQGQKVLIIAGLGGTGTRGAIALLMQLDNYDLAPRYNTNGEAVLFTVDGDTNNNGICEPSELWEISVL